MPPASYSFPVTGAQSVTCTVADDAVEVRINRLAIDGLQLEIQATSDGGQWLGIYQPGQPASFIGSLVGAIILLLVIRLVQRRTQGPAR